MISPIEFYEEGLQGCNDMKFISLDTNIISSWVKAKRPVSEFEDKLAEINFIPLVTPDVFYELARNFINYPEHGKDVFSFLLNCKNVCYSRYHTNLYQMEYERSRNSDKLPRFLAEGAHSQEIQNRIRRYSKGDFDERQFVDERQYYLQKEHLEHFKKTRISRDMSWESILNSYFEKIKGDDEAQESLRANLSRIIRIEVTKDQALSLIFTDFSDFPALHSSFRRNLWLQHLTSISMSSDTFPSEDRFTDGMILVQSAYCAAFLSDDKKLNDNAKKINPNIQVYTLDSQMSAVPYVKIIQR